MISLFNVILKKRLKNKLEVHDKMTITKQDFFFYYMSLKVISLLVFSNKYDRMNLRHMEQIL